MENPRHFFDELYNNFNLRRIEKVIVHLADNVQWANGMEGGYVYGHEGVREYWTRQFTMINARVTPLDIEASDDRVKIKVHQVVHDLNGELVSDEVVEHTFYLAGDTITRFEIGEQG